MHPPPVFDAAYQLCRSASQIAGCFHWPCTGFHLFLLALKLGRDQLPQHASCRGVSIPSGSSGGDRQPPHSLKSGHWLHWLWRGWEQQSNLNRVKSTPDVKHTATSTYSLVWLKLEACMHDYRHGVSHNNLQQWQVLVDAFLTNGKRNKRNREQHCNSGLLHHWTRLVRFAGAQTSGENARWHSLQPRQFRDPSEIPGLHAIKM